MKKIKELIKNNRWVIITALLSSVIILVIYTLQKIAPFGNNSMLDVDFYHQYGPLLNELYDRVKTGETLLYSFNTGGGIPFYRNFLNYLSSPFNLILFLFKKENIVMAFSIIIGLKAIFASASMSYYLKKTFKKNDILTCIFGMLYAFSGYFCAYYWNIMWLDGMVFLPIIMYGINKIVEEEKPNLYIISLMIMLFANYFIGYMICIFSVLYFIGVFLYKRNFKLKNIIKKFVMFAISSLLAGGLIAFVLLPLFNSISSISATGGTFPATATSFSISNYVFNHFTGVSRTVFASDILPLPNVYPGMLTLACIILLFINKNVNWRFKLIAFISLLFFFFSFNITTIDYIWHAFHVPNDLPWRYSFLYVFVLITIGYYALSKIKELSVFKISISYGIVFILVLLASKLGFENLNDNKIITCLIFLVLYYIITIIYKYNKIDKRFIYSIFILFIMIECIIGIDKNWDIDHDIKTFMQDKKIYQTFIKDIRKDDNGLYRIEKTDYLTLNDGAWYDYYGMSTFTSMAYEDVSKLQRMLGISGNDINSYYYRYYATPVYNTIFNIKYLMGDYIENDYYVPLDSNDTYNITGYKYSSSIAYAVNKELEDWKLFSYKPFLNQSNFVTLSTGVNDVFESAKVISVNSGKILDDNFNINSNGEFNYEVITDENELSFTLDNKDRKNVYLYVGGNKVQSFEVNNSYYSLTSDEYYIVDTGKIDSDYIDIRVSLEDSEPGTIKFYAYTINDEAFMKFYEKINKETLEVTRYNDTLIEGNINVSSDKMVFSTIAYDTGWSVYVDGKKVKIRKIAKSYIGFNIQKGEHKIKFVYYPKGMKEGLIISMISLIMLVTYNILKDKRVIKNNKKGKFIV